MLDDCFVLDCVVHPFNFDRSNFLSPSAEMFANHLYAFHQVLTPAGQRLLQPEEFLRDWAPAEVAEMALAESRTRPDLLGSVHLRGPPARRWCPSCGTRLWSGWIQAERTRWQAIRFRSPHRVRRTSNRPIVRAARSAW